MVERPNLVQNGQIQPSSCCKIAFAGILLHLRAGKKAKMHRLRRRIVRRKKPNQALVQHLANEQSLYARAWRLFSLSPLSPLPSFPFSPPPLLSPPLSVLFSKTDLGKRAPGKQPHGWYGGHLGSICGLCARVKHLCCAQKPPNRSSGEAKTQKPTKSTVTRKRRFFEGYAKRIQRCVL